MDKNKKSPKYQKLEVEEAINKDSQGMHISFRKFGVSFFLRQEDVKRFGLENLSPGDIIFAKSKTGDEEADFVGANMIQDIYFKKS